MELEKNKTQTKSELLALSERNEKVKEKLRRLAKQTEEEKKKSTERS